MRDKVDLSGQNNRRINGQEREDQIRMSRSIKEISSTKKIKSEN
jgi:hypothetical protein